MSEKLSHINPKYELPEINLKYYRNGIDISRGIASPDDAAKLIRSLFAEGEIELHECMFVVFLDRANHPIAYYRHSVGGIDGTVLDMRIVLAAALKTLAGSIIIAHNHPSGNTLPSEADKKVTNDLRAAGQLLNIHLLDSLIVTKESYRSLADEGLMGIDSPYPIVPKGTVVVENTPDTNGISQNERKYVDRIIQAIRNNEKNNISYYKKLAGEYVITDKTKIKELSELAIVKMARELAHKSGTVKEKYNRIVELYEKQVNLSFRTSQSILLQQYSTPAPIGFLMGIFCGIDKEKSVFEPSAGNGLLTIAAKPENVTVNEIDHVRRQNLLEQGYKKVLALDASETFTEFPRKFDAVLTNPPFGRLGGTHYYASYKITELDHLMALKALDTMKVNGKAAIIIGGHTKWDEKGRIQKGRNRIFFNYLYGKYNVVDVIHINGRNLYSRQGTSFPTRLILIDGVKEAFKGTAPLKNEKLASVVKSFGELYERVMAHINTEDMERRKFDALELEALELEAALLDETLGAPYVPSSDACMVLDTQVPDAMSFEMHEAVNRIKVDVGGDIDNFVRHRLGYRTKMQLCKALSAEQTDAVAMAIYNIEALQQSVIIGDQTGIGKGRVAASIIRYAVEQGKTPIFLTEKANLFSDIYRDLSAIGSAHLKPFIVNSRDTKTHIKDQNGNIIYEALSQPEQKTIFENKEVPQGYDYVVATYSQFNSPDKKPLKPQFLSEIVKENIIIMDESHNASGSSNTGVYMQSILAKASGAVFLSATFAKRPDNMPLYAMKTAISEANMTKDELVEAILKGGVALQEILASQLVAEGQMIRRERTYEGIEVNYETLTDLAQEHKAVADNVTRIIRDIIKFQETYVDKRVGELDEIAAAEGEEVDLREGTNKAGVDNLPYFSKVFNIINQMLFSIKAEAVAEKAIRRLKEGKKPIIAFASTMGSFIEQLDDGGGRRAVEGDTVSADFALVLEKGLEGVLRYTVTLPDGQRDYKVFDITELSHDAQMEYNRILDEIKTASTGITISPIDVIIQKIESAGYAVAEVTGRRSRLQLNLKNNTGIILSRKKINTNDAFRKFNDNEVDVLLINQSGSTGASAHAIVTDKVPAEEVRQRVMIVLQPELDINTEVQKRGRIHRTGQILKPQYDYMNSAIPAEQRLMMMLQKKLKSLDANTSSNQKQSSDVLDVPDFLNKYGDEVVIEYLKENEEINALLGDPLNISKGSGTEQKEGAAHKVSGRVAVLSTKMQEDFYLEIKDRYDTLVDYLKQTGEYDLEVEQLDLQAKTISQSVIKVGKGGISSFGEDSILEKVEVNILKKPFKRSEVENLIKESLEGKSADQISDMLVAEYEDSEQKLLDEKSDEINERYDLLLKDVPNEKKVQKLLDAGDHNSADVLILERRKELEAAREKRLNDESTKFNNRKTYLRGLFKFFTIGKKLEYPIESYSGVGDNQLAVFVGFQIDRKKKNPFAPSGVKLKFAVASSKKFVAIPASYVKDVNAIKGASVNVSDHGLKTTLNEWETKITENTKDRGHRHIVTGNLLQAFADFNGKLVSYTTLDGQVKKGILLPENWEQSNENQGKVTVPIAKALKVIQSLTTGAAIYASSDIAIFKQNDMQFRIAVPASRKKGGDIFLNEGLMKLVEKNIFEKIGDRMVAMLPIDNLPKFVEILQNELGVTVSLFQNQIDSVGLVSTKTKRKVDIAIPPPEESGVDPFEIELLELEAEALALELELAA
ncbi:MAG: strawberry notch C-terminal domain-containing protein [Crocinitomicaceae bacterium]|nr:strawberry notch C-terminal domain-containing protein [Crocinitomicaceae bacterium]